LTIGPRMRFAGVSCRKQGRQYETRAAYHLRTASECLKNPDHLSRHPPHWLIQAPLCGSYKH
jgi:hypothetical protein